MSKTDKMLIVTNWHPIDMIMPMDWINVLSISVSMSIDAMVVGSADGLNEPQISVRKMLLIALAFGVFQFGMPTIGYFVGYAFKEALTVAIPWIAFSLLTLLAVKSFVEFIKDLKVKEEEKVAKTLRFPELMMQAVATSIDALCIGFVFLTYQVGEAMISFSIVGVTTFALSFLMVLLGKFLGTKIKIFQKYAGLFAAIVFFGIGLKILLEGIL